MDGPNYFRPYKNYFWEWEEDGRVIAIPNSATIAYKEQMSDVVERLAPQGLPLFGALLLTVIATNPNAQSALDAVNAIMTRVLKTPESVYLTKAMTFLRMLSSLPEPYKKGDRRALLLQVLFSRSHNSVSVSDSKVVYEYLIHMTTPQEPVERHSDDTRDLKVVALLGLRFKSVHDILEALAGVPDANQIEIEFQPEPGDQPSDQPDLVDALIANSATFTVGSLIRWLWGGLNIPVHSALPSVQPLGGVSDLTNKGDFDKLLVSEFANDDLVFLSRLANNEALYIHREIPPAHNDLKRVILIDASIKCWGTPKAIAFATMLAIARHPKTDIDCEAFVLGADTYHPVAIDNIHTIIDALHIVAGTLHCAEALGAFLNDRGRDKNKEVFFITEASTVKQSALLKTMTEYHQQLNYVVFTDVEGNIDVYKRHQSSKKHVQHIKLPLETLWKKDAPPTKQAKFSKERAHAMEPYPVLFRERGHAKKILQASNGEIFQISGSKAIFRLFDKTKEKHQRGWDLVYQNLPFNTSIAEVGISRKGEYVFLLFNANTREVLLVNISTGHAQSVPFPQWRSTGTHEFLFEDDKFLHSNHGGAWGIGLDGTVLSGPFADKGRYEARADELVRVSSIFTYVPGVFKNIHTVFINASGQLIFNKHALTLGQVDKSIRMSTTKDLFVKVQAKRLDDGGFEFPGEKKVMVNSLGIVMLKSGDNAHETVYIPSSQIDSLLGMATLRHFAGNEFYFKEPLFEVMLQTAGRSRLATIKIIRQHCDMALDAVGVLVDAAPALLPVYLTEDKALEMKRQLEENHAKVEVNSAHGFVSKMEKISTTEFFAQHITPFIKTILDHGA